MKKFLYIAAIMATVATATTSCNNEVDDLFDKSAAERTQEAVDEYSSVLTANGGKWVLEYFTNPDEPGYIYIFTFDSNGSVKISGKNKWIENQFKSETSAWEVISDNGPVLTLNTYNTIFHLFANPENVVVPGATSDDIDETGYGHYGDYEFMLMEANDGVVRLKGKKWGVTHYLRQLDANTDDEAYLAQVEETQSKLFSKYFANLIVTDANGYRFVMSNQLSGVADFYPEDGDAITQTHSFNFIGTIDGIRFMREVELDHANMSDAPSYFQTFTVQEDGSLLCTEDGVTRITAQELSTLLGVKSLTWTIDPETISGKFVDAYNTAAADMKKVFKGSKNLKAVSFASANNGEKVLTNSIQITGGSAKGNQFVNITAVDANNISIATIDEVDKNLSQFYTKAPSLKTLVDMIATTSFKCSTDNVLMPSTIKMVSTSDENDYFYVTVR